LKDRIGVCLQATNLPDKITLREAVGVFSSLYSHVIHGDALLKRSAMGRSGHSGARGASGRDLQRREARACGARTLPLRGATDARHRSENR
jgi:ABC-2 type transport system ATP-binding protein